MNALKLSTPWFPHSRATLLAAVCFGCGLVAANAPDPLATAKRLAETRYRGWTYGSDPSTKRIDCTQFVLAVVEEQLSMKAGFAARKAILIDHGWSEKEIQQIVEEGRDSRLGGVHFALTEVMKRGKTVKASDARPGDIIQYWMKRSDGTWYGHAGVIASVQNGKVKIYGAHQSQNRIEESRFELDLAGDRRRIYMVRIE